MRREEKKITCQETIKFLLKKTLVCRIALCHGNKPYLVPMNYAYQDNQLFFHSAREGKKIDFIKNNSTICFEMDHLEEITKSENPCKWGAKYWSIIGYGEVSFILNTHQKEEALQLLMEKYSGTANHTMVSSSLERVEVFKVEIQSLSGKSSGYGNLEDLRSRTE